MSRPASAPGGRCGEAAPASFGFGEQRSFDAHCLGIKNRSEHVTALAKRRRQRGHSAAPARGALPSRFHQESSAARARRESAPNFNCTLRRPTREDIAMGHAKQAAAMWGFKRTPDHIFRATDADPARQPRGAAGTRFVLQIATDSRQTQKLAAARAQGGMMAGRALRCCPCHDVDPADDPDSGVTAKFVGTVRSSANKTASLQARVDVARDQGRLWDGGQTIQQHQYRGPLVPGRVPGAAGGAAGGQTFVLDFHLPDHSKEMATAERFPVFDQPEDAEHAAAAAAAGLKRGARERKMRAVAEAARRCRREAADRTVARQQKLRQYAAAIAACGGGGGGGGGGGSSLLRSSGGSRMPGQHSRSTVAGGESVFSVRSMPSTRATGERALRYESPVMWAGDV
jgi:hypothetical protein